MTVDWLVFGQGVLQVASWCLKTRILLDRVNGRWLTDGWQGAGCCLEEDVCWLDVGCLVNQEADWNKMIYDIISYLIWYLILLKVEIISNIE